MAQSQDTAHLSQNKPAGLEGIRGVIQFYKDGTQEVHDLLNNECDTLFECRYCRAIFRSIINFTAHKRQYCKGTFGAIAANASALWEEYLENMSKEHSNETEEGRARRSLMHVLNRRSLDVSVDVPGHPDPLILHTYPRIGRDVKPEPTAIVGVPSQDDSSLPDDRVPVVFPTDPNFRQKSQTTQMRMRSKRDGILATSGTELSTHEMACLHRILKYNPDIITEGSQKKCDHPDCKEIKIFSSYAFLAYHIGMKHSYRVQETEKIPCYLCNHTIKSWSSYYGHYVRVHKMIRDEHDRDRMLAELGPDAKRRDYRRGRSLSPECDGTVKDANEANGGEMKTEESTPSSIHAIADNDAAEEDDEQDPMPKLSRMTRRRKSRGGRSQSQDEMKALSRCSTPSSYSTELTDNNGLTVEEILERKFEKDIADAVEMLISETEELMGDKPLEAKSEKKTTASGRSTPGSQRGRRGGKRTVTMKNGNNNMEEKDNEETEEKDEDDVLLSQLAQKKEEGGRQGRTRKRPVWMETYMMDDGEKSGGKRHKTEEVAVKEEATSSTTPQKIARQYGSKAQNTRSASKRAPSVETLPKNGRKEKTRYTAPKKEQRSPSASQLVSQDIVLPAVHGSSKSRRSGRFIPEDDDRILTPRAKKIIDETDPPSSPGSSRRKQDMSLARDASDEVRIISTNGKLERYSDLSTVPVFLSQAQRDMFFAGLKPKNPKNTGRNQPHDGAWYCEFCNLETPSLKEGRRHMVGHIRVMRLRCKLCHAGAFFCTDMRMHLQERYCPQLHKAPEGYVKMGKPCMRREDADHLTEIVDLANPGRVCYTSGQIVSSLSKAPYFPDPVIEERILGPSRVPGNAYNSPQKTRSSAVRRF